MRRVRSVTAVVLTSLLLLSLAGCAWLDVRQRELIYRPTPGVPADFAGLRTGDERYFVTLPQVGGQRVGATGEAPQRVEMWWLPHTDQHAPTLLYFHGTFRTLYDNLHKIDALRAAGFSVLAVDYRGWGASTPIIPSEQSILQDADVAWAELQRREPRPQRRVIYGHSMGSAVAVDLASRLRARDDYAALILESAFTSFADVAREAGWLPHLLAQFTQERFASVEKIGHVQAPLLMLHGAADTTVAPKLGARLFTAANEPKHWLMIDHASHSDLDQVDEPAYQAALQSFRTTYLAREPLQ